METEAPTDTFKRSITTAHLWMHTDEILYIQLDSSKHDSLGVEEASEICDVIVEVSQGRKVKFLTDTRGVVGTVEQGARELIRNHPGIVPVRCAEAFVVDSLANKIIADFYIRFNKPDNPTRVFRQLDTAMEWLDSIEIEP